MEEIHEARYGERVIFFVVSLGIPSTLKPE